MVINRDKIRRPKELDWVIQGPTDIYFRLFAVHLRQGFKGQFFSFRGKYHEEGVGEGWAQLLINADDLKKHPILNKLVEDTYKSFGFELEQLKGVELTIHGSIYKGKPWTNRDNVEMDNHKFSKDISNIRLYNQEGQNENQ